MADVGEDADDSVDKYLQEMDAAVQATISAAERHLNLPEGTLSSIRKDGDFMFVMKMWSTLEVLLNEAISKEITDGLRKYKIEHEGAEALATYVTKGGLRDREIELAERLGILRGGRKEYCLALYKVRNHYAHNITNIHLTVWDIVSKRKDKTSVYKGLTYIEPLDWYTERFHNDNLRVGAYYQFSSFLSDVLNVLKPPPFRGLLGEIAAMNVEGGEHSDGEL